MVPNDSVYNYINILGQRLWTDMITVSRNREIVY